MIRHEVTYFDNFVGTFTKRLHLPLRLGAVQGARRHGGTPAQLADRREVQDAYFG